MEVSSFNSVQYGIDAFHEAVGHGRAQVFYVKPDCSEKGLNIRFGDHKDINIRNLSDTHVFLCSGDENLDPEDFFCNLQGERWSPNGEANALIRSKGLAHTSMSVGDIVVLPIENSTQKKVMFVANVGFVCLGFIE